MKDERKLNIMHHASLAIPSTKLSHNLMAENHPFLLRFFQTLDPSLAIFLYPTLFLNKKTANVEGCNSFVCMFVCFFLFLFLKAIMYYWTMYVFNYTAKPFNIPQAETFHKSWKLLAASLRTLSSQLELTMENGVNSIITTTFGEVCIFLLLFIYLTVM